MSYLPYISDNDLENAVTKVVDCIRNVQNKSDDSLYKNVVDPFSAIFDSVVYGISFKDWLEREKVRQAQKTLQNAIGYFHQDIIGGINGWHNVSSGQLIDVFNPKQKVIAKLKNKHNTVKGSDKIAIYDNLSYALGTPTYQGFKAYYVEIIPKKDRQNKIYNQPFTPPDNKIKTKRPANQNIIIIKGENFYDMATGTSGALSMLFDVLPDIITKVGAISKLSQEEKIRFKDLFKRAY